MEAATTTRHCRTAEGWRSSRVSRLTAPQFVAAVVAAKADADWACASGGRGGVSFFLQSDKLRHARLVFERDVRNMGPTGAATPMVYFGADEASLFEVAADDATAWVLHLRSRRNHVESDVAFLKALFSVLKL